MPRFQDQTYLTSVQYKDASNLNARIQLHERYSTNTYGWFKWVFDQFCLPVEANILDIGCGSGALWQHNLSRIPNGWHLTMSDLSAGMLAECKRKLDHAPLHLSFETANAEAIPFPSESFDSVIANHMLYHVPDRRMAIHEIARVLKCSGFLYAATNGENHLRELDSMMDQQCMVGNEGLVSGRQSRDFTLENGAAQLAPWFQELHARYYPDALIVTEVEPLMAYIRSMVLREAIQMDGAGITNIHQAIEKHIRERGFIKIQKSTGMFIAKK